ncbi:MAG: Tat pathway signal protein [Gammaproteobacteria bacterium]|nr:Tat pathway signal protein [Gammaproteobacteria bacterium]MDH5241041.1 Tat pathway signal protein [Gammaproteobacteria bacterium]MDH5262126.1 Tat pathway signal protein [Gammaproteobacteria bacterium]
MGSQAYTDLAKRLRELPASGHGDPKQALIQAATLAASSHNTQPWTFRAGSDSITIEPDLSRRCEVVDPDDSHLFKSLGCAAANIVAAAPVYGFRTDVQLEDDGQIVIGLTMGKAITDRGALNAIAERQCTKTPYDGRSLGTDETAELESAGTGEGVRVQLIDDAALRETLLDLVNEGNRLQLSDPAFRSELIAWIRFNDAAAIRSGDGLSGRASGQPQLPTWLAKPIMRFVLTPQAQAKKDTVNLRSSAGIAVFIGETDERRSWVEAGQAYERFALRATALGIRNAFINQPIEVRRLRSELHSALGLRGAQTAHLMVRYGHAALAPYSLRRRIADVRTA